MESLEQRMIRIARQNEELKRRHLEVERDRLAAEKNNASVTKRVSNRLEDMMPAERDAILNKDKDVNTNSNRRKPIELPNAFEKKKVMDESDLRHGLIRKTVNNQGDTFNERKLNMTILSPRTDFSRTICQIQRTDVDDVEKDLFADVTPLDPSLPLDPLLPSDLDQMPIASELDSNITKPQQFTEEIELLNVSNVETLKQVDKYLLDMKGRAPEFAGDPKDVLYFVKHKSNTLNQSNNERINLPLATCHSNQQDHSTLNEDNRHSNQGDFQPMSNASEEVTKQKEQIDLSFLQFIDFSKPPPISHPSNIGSTIQPTLDASTETSKLRPILGRGALEKKSSENVCFSSDLTQDKAVKMDQLVQTENIYVSTPYEPLCPGTVNPVLSELSDLSKHNSLNPNTVAKSQFDSFDKTFETINDKRLFNMEASQNANSNISLPPFQARMKFDGQETFHKVLNNFENSMTENLINSRESVGSSERFYNKSDPMTFSKLKDQPNHFQEWAEISNNAYIPRKREELEKLNENVSGLRLQNFNEFNGFERKINREEVNQTGPKLTPLQQRMEAVRQETSHRFAKNMNNFPEQILEVSLPEPNVVPQELLRNKTERRMTPLQERMAIVRQDPSRRFSDPVQDRDFPHIAANVPNQSQRKVDRETYKSRFQERLPTENLIAPPGYVQSQEFHKNLNIYNPESCSNKTSLQQRMEAVRSETSHRFAKNFTSSEGTIEASYPGKCSVDKDRTISCKEISSQAQNIEENYSSTMTEANANANIEIKKNRISSGASGMFMFEDIREKEKRASNSHESEILQVSYQS